MMRPPPSAFMPGMQYLANKNGPVRLMPRMAAHSSSGIVSTGWGSMLSPALLTRMATGRPKWATACSTAALTSALSATFACTGKIDMPCSPSLAANALAPARLLL